MRSSWLIFSMLILFISLIDISIFYLYIKPTLHKGKTKKIVKNVHWIIYILFFIAFLTYTIIIPRIKGPELYFWFSRLIAIFTLVYIPKIVVLIFSILGATRYFISQLIYGRHKRKYFIVNKLGIIAAIIVINTMFYGFSVGRYDYRIKTVEISSNKIPQVFNNFRIVHISDFHLGSYGKSYKGVDKAIDEVNKQNPDIIAFTGDMINNFASEMLPWMNSIKSFKSKYGKYSILGNHDYGSYVKWNNLANRQTNIDSLLSYQKEVGFDVLNNVHRTIRIGKDSIFLAGVENWGKPPFPTYGKLKKALKGTSKNVFTILMSHDPSHWEAQVVESHTDLMLAGHTHAMQMGIEIGSFKWSPAKYLYKYWDGLYKKADKYLYVNRGLGYIAFPGRILQRPEITVIVLKRKE